MKLRVVPFNLRTTTSQNWEGFRGGLVSKAHRLWYHSTLGARVIEKHLLRESVSVTGDSRVCFVISIAVSQRR